MADHTEIPCPPHEAAGVLRAPEGWTGRWRSPSGTICAITWPLCTSRADAEKRLASVVDRMNHDDGAKRYRVSNTVLYSRRHPGEHEEESE